MIAIPDNALASTRIVLVDDHPIVRRGLGQMLEQQVGLEVCAEAGSISEALTAISEGRPDMLIVDLTLGGEDGIQLIKQVSRRWPMVRVLVLSMHSEKLYAERAIRAGAHGYVMKQEPPEQIVEAVRRISSGGVYLSTRLQAEWLRLVKGGKRSLSTPVESLTDRELTVFRLIGTGHSTRDIAARLHLSVKTVDTHRANLKQKLGLQSATELLQHATLWFHQEAGG